MPISLHRLRTLGPAAATLALAAACTPDAPTAARAGDAMGPSLDRAGYDQPGMHRQYGTPQKLGNGMVRTYVVLDAKAGQTPVELGVALDARALEGLPNDAQEHSLILQLPEHSPAPYRFVELDWNPQGHPPVGVYTVPHFDFHFYTMSLAEHDAISPTQVAKGRNVPTGEYVPPGYVVPGDPGTQIVPRMGVHWFSVQAPELQGLFGHPELAQPFTKTFIYGSWDGHFTFYEPMVTRAYLLSRPDVTTPIPVPARYPQAGYFPTSYRVSYDAQAREYRVAISGLTLR